MRSRYERLARFEAEPPTSVTRRPSSPDYLAPDAMASLGRGAPVASFAGPSQLGAYRNPDVADEGRYQQMLADAKRASDFVAWMFGPPNEPARAPANQSAGASSAPKNFHSTPVAQDSFNDRWPGPFDFGTSPAPPMIRNPFFSAPQDDPQYPFSNQPGSPFGPNQGPQIAPPARPPSRNVPPQPQDTLSPEQRAQHCALDPAAIAADFGNRLQPDLGKIDPATGQVITQDWINRQAAQMQRTVEQIQTGLGCPSEMY
jgi:hypothetical protein